VGLKALRKLGNDEMAQILNYIKYPPPEGYDNEM
jgi:hypothetical protein